MHSSTPLTGRGIGETLSRRYARSTWRFPVLCIVAAIAVFAPLYLVRGMRLVQLGAAALVALTGAAILFAQPFPALAVAFFVQYSGLDFYLPGPVSGAILGLVLARIAFDRWPPRAGVSLDWGTTAFRFGLAGLFASAVTSLLVVWRWENALGEVRNFVLGLGFLIAFAALVDRPSRLRALLLVLALATGATAIPLVRALLSPGGWALIAIAPEARFGGVGYDSNMLATAANCALPALAFLVRRTHGWRRLALLALVLLLILEILVSHSRAGMLILGMLAVVLLVYWSRRRPWVPAVVIAAIVAGLMWMPSMYWVRFASIGQLGGIVVDRSLLLRTHLLEGAWRMFLDHFWIGVGLGNFANEAARFMLGEWVAHNGYLEVGASLGIFGLVSYLVLLGSAAHMLWQAARRARRAGDDDGNWLAMSLLLGLGAFCIATLTLSIHFQLMLWILLAFANAVRRCSLKPTSTPAGV